MTQLDHHRSSQIEEMVHAHQARLRAFLYSRTGNRDVADDLAQEVFLVVIDRIEDFDTTRPAWPWLLGIARNKLREHWRERSRSDEAGELERFLATMQLERATPDAEPDWHEERLEILRRCCEKLNPASGTLIDLVYRQGLTSEEAATRLKKTAGAVRVTLHRIRRTLAECIERQLRSLPT